MIELARVLLLRALKQDPFGADQPSPIPRPVDDGVPRRYRATVRRTTRIPINERSLRAELDRVLRRKPRLIRFLDQELTNSKRDISLDELVGALSSGDVDGPWLERWRNRYARMINRRIAPEWEAAQRAGADVAIPGLRGILGPDTDFALLGRRFDEWTRQRAGTLVVGISETQRQALASMIRQWSTFDAQGPRTAARFIRPLIGLTPRDAASLAKQSRTRIEAGEPEAAVRVSIANQTATRIRRRADTIAETELAFAYNFGTWHAVREAESQGAFGGDTVVKVWSTQIDERVCPFCGPLDGAQIGLDETFPGKTRALPNTFAPPAHPRCRCVLLYEFIEAEAELDLDAIAAGPEPLAGPFDGPLEQREPLPGSKPLDEDEVWSVIDDELDQIARSFGMSIDGLRQFSEDQRNILRIGPVSNADQGSQARLDTINRLEPKMNEFLDSVRQMNPVGSSPFSGVAGLPATIVRRDLPGEVDEALRLLSRAYGDVKPGRHLRVSRLGDDGRAGMGHIVEPDPGASRMEILDRFESLNDLPGELHSAVITGVQRWSAGRSGKFDDPISWDDPAWSDVVEKWEKKTGRSRDSLLGFRQTTPTRAEVLRVFDELPFEEGFFPVAKRISGELDRDFVNEIRPLMRTTLSGELLLTSHDPKWVVYHELGHFAQVTNGRVSDAEQAFLERRWRESGTSTEKLSDITGNASFRPDERANPDKFVSPYVGKIYRRRQIGGFGMARGNAPADAPGTEQSSEVLTMGIQELVSPRTALALLIDDPEHFALTIALIRGRFGYRDNLPSEGGVFIERRAIDR